MEPGGQVGGGVLVDEAGHTYAPFETSGPRHDSGSGLYTATLHWSQIHRVAPIDAGKPGTSRRFVAKFYDASSSIHGDGNQATMDIDIHLTCGNDLDICNGACKESCAAPSEPVATNQ